MGCGKSKHDVASGNTLLQRKKSSVKHNKGQEIGTQTKDDNNKDKVNVNVNSEVEVQKEGDNVKEVVGGKADDDSNGVKSKTENANVQEEETELEKKSKEVVAGGEKIKSSKSDNANVGEEKVLEKGKEVVAGGDEVKSSKSDQNANVGEEKVLEKSEEVVTGADEVKSITENANVQEEIKVEKKGKEFAGEEGLVPQEASEKSQGGEDDTLKLKENDQKVNAAAAAEEKKTGDGKEDVSVKEEILAKEEASKDINVSTPEGEEKDLKAEEEQKENPLCNEDVKAN